MSYRNLYFFNECFCHMTIRIIECVMIVFLSKNIINSIVYFKKNSIEIMLNLSS